MFARGWRCFAGGKESKTDKEYFHRIRSILKSKLNGGNVVAAVNEKGVFLLRFSTGILEWKKTEVEAID